MYNPILDDFEEESTRTRVIHEPFDESEVSDVESDDGAESGQVAIDNNVDVTRQIKEGTLKDIEKRMRTMRKLGVPYTDDELATAEADAMAQATEFLRVISEFPVQ